MMRIVGGIILLLLGGVLGLAGFTQLMTVTEVYPGNEAYRMEFIAGKILGIVILGGLTFFCITRGIRLVKKKK